MYHVPSKNNILVYLEFPKNSPELLNKLLNYYRNQLNINNLFDSKNFWNIIFGSNDMVSENRTWARFSKYVGCSRMLMKILETPTFLQKKIDFREKKINN